MIQPISGQISSAAQTFPAAAGVSGPPKAQQPENGPQDRSPAPVTDEYIPEEKREPSGLYWLEKDEDGRPKICFDSPERGAPGGGAERCTCSTDRVDREIEQLKKKRDELTQQISAQTDEAKLRELEQKLARVESELGQKDNDTYRRQNAVFS